MAAGAERPDPINLVEKLHLLDDPFAGGAVQQQINCSYLYAVPVDEEGGVMICVAGIRE